MNFTEEYRVRKTEFEEYLRQFTSEFIKWPQELCEAVSYSLVGGGKRLRPILLLETIRIFNGEVDTAAVNFALAVECIHTYSLIHDDLPCMDNDDYRRGKLSCHKKFDEATAVLAGDALLNLAYELIFGAVALGNFKEKYLKAGIAIASAAGGNGMIGGQIRELTASLPLQSVDYIYEHKTAALIVASLRAGAILGEASESELDKIERFGKAFGYGFQLCDDLLDRNSEDPEKITYLSINGEEKTKSVLKTKTVEAIQALDTLENAAFLIELTTCFMERDK